MFKFISSFYYYCPFKEYALHFGNVWNGKHRFKYYETLKEIYPDTYILNPWDKEFYYWGNIINPKEYLTAYDSIYVYTYNQNEDTRKKIFESFFYTDPEIFNNPKTGESIFLLKKMLID